MTTSRLAVAILFLSACGEDVPRSGVNRSTPVVDLTSDDIQTFCDWAIDLEGGNGHTHHCEDGSTRTTKSVGNCVDTLADLTCTDPIGSFEDCLLAVDGDLCLIADEPACAAFDACFPLF